ncbi:MAG TPA: FtsX-like permease family protein [Casimicrobiaceae bacterium]|nr:FtsX-like permease family protein [Casimicrobiaceae bacterium]
MRKPRLSAARAVLAGALVQNKARSALSVLAIALGVALGYAVSLITGAAVNELALGVQFLAGDADLQVRGPRGGFDEAVYPRLARLPDVAAASPVVEADARLEGRDDVLRIVGIDVFRAGTVEPALVAESSDRFDHLRSDTLFLSPAAARSLGVDAGGTLAFQVGLRDVTLRVAGLVPAEGQQRFAVMDIAGAQSNFDRLGRISRVDLRLRPGVDIETARARIQLELPPGVAVERRETSVGASASLSRSYRVNLNVLALVALFTGGLLVFSTQALAVVRRRSQLALLRVLGMTRRELAGLLVLEGAIVGIAGSALGLAGGFALAQIAVLVIGADLGAGYFRGVAPALALAPVSLAIFFCLGVLIAMLASLAPALEAARAAPAAALKAGDEERAFARLSPPWPGFVTIGIGAIATLVPPVAGLPLFGYIAIALLVIGTLMLMPRIAVMLLEVLPLPSGAPSRLALLQLRGAPGQVAVSLAAIVAAVSLMVSMAIMVASFRTSLDAWLERVLPADLYVRAGAAGDTAYLGPDDQSRLAALPGVRRADFQREQQLLLDPARPRVVLLARNIDAANLSRQLQLVGGPVAVGPGAPPPAWVNEAMVDLYGFAPGKVVELPIAGKPVAFTVAGVWRDYARPQGAIVIERERYIALTGDRNASSAALWLAPGAKPEALSQAIAHDVPGGAKLDIAAPGEIRELSLQTFDRTFAVTYALELAAVVIGLFGLSSSFGALVLARRREFGMLRHIGMTRRQIGAMVATEGLIVTAVGLVAGFGLGWLISLVLIHVVNRQSFHWGMELNVPWSALAGSAVVVLALSIVTALASGRQAMSRRAVLAVKEDW